ncbi:TPA: hypothetical protein EYP12_01780, partial [Candidatus Bipolaricaulota bacterium]|nr:hypothetical protein [Candidatus Bipolaricaulota bacterium]
NRISSSFFPGFYGITEPHLILVLDEKLLRTADITGGLSPKGTIIINAPPQRAALGLGLDLVQVQIFAVNATEIARECTGRPIPNVSMLGALLKVEPLAKLETVEGIVEHSLGFAMTPDQIEANIKALHRGYEEVRSVPSGAGGTSIMPIREDGPSPGPGREGYDLDSVKESYIKWAILPKGTALQNKTGNWRGDRYPVYKPWKCQACPPGREACPDASLDCTIACQRACLLCWVFCPEDCIVLRDGVPSYIDMNYCKGCGICANICPREAFEMREVK